MPEKLTRFGISMESGLLLDFDRFIHRHGYTNRSEAIRDLIRDRLIGEKWEAQKESLATLTIVYDHHVPGLTEKIISMQHDFGGRVISSMHVHLDHHHCLEVNVLQAKPKEIQSLANKLLATKGVKHGGIIRTAIKPETT